MELPWTLNEPSTQYEQSSVNASHYSGHFRGLGIEWLLLITQELSFPVTESGCQRVSVCSGRSLGLNLGALTQVPALSLMAVCSFGQVPSSLWASVFLPGL